VGNKLGKREKIMNATQLFRALVATGLIFAAGCASDQPPRTAGQAIDDQAVARRVEEALRSDPAYKFTEVKVVAYEGKVQLGGFVDKGEQKGQAEDIARKVPGVKEVQNEIAMKR
jgi:osmotically-inducible protein OsmY